MAPAAAPPADARTTPHTPEPPTAAPSAPPIPPERAIGSASQPDRYGHGKIDAHCNGERESREPAGCCTKRCSRKGSDQTGEVEKVHGILERVGE